MVASPLRPANAPNNTPPGLLTEEALVEEIDRRQAELQGIQDELALRSAEEQRLLEELPQELPRTCGQCDARLLSLKSLFRGLSRMCDIALQLHSPAGDASELPLYVTHQYLLELADVGQSCSQVDPRFAQVASYANQKAVQIQAQALATPQTPTPIREAETPALADG
ncbi:unnamed protein product [Durusdinium trenchii]|uniref:Uncharacterized protein n=1 Tax=Durusdinium trenchii TaxID=1381693 RepID=A0ABP0M1F7_9DINO